MTLFLFHREIEAVRKNSLQLPALWVTNIRILFPSFSQVSEDEIAFCLISSQSLPVTFFPTTLSCFKGSKNFVHLLLSSLFWIFKSLFPCSFSTACEYTQLYPGLKTNTQSPIPSNLVSSSSYLPPSLSAFTSSTSNIDILIPHISTSYSPSWALMVHHGTETSWANIPNTLPSFALNV